MLDDNCLFCKIIKGAIPAAKVYEDDSVLVFKDISPKAPVHLLAVPKEHFATVQEIPADRADIMGKLFAAVGTVAVKEGFAARGYRMVVNSGEQAGQAVPHIHVHVLAGRPLAWPPG
jgi:histidine triad (HIT) family protein